MVAPGNKATRLPYTNKEPIIIIIIISSNNSDSKQRIDTLLWLRSKDLNL